MKKKLRIKIGITVVVICVMGFSDRSFAEEGGEGIKIFGLTLNYIINAMAWLWIFFAKGAGEFLTNKRVYGELLGIDVLLRKYRNVIKNFANFGLGLYFIYLVLKGLISDGKDSIQKIVKNNLIWLLVAGIGIQTSWFLTALAVDLSTVTLSAAGSLPAYIISNNSKIEGTLEDNLTKSFNVEGGQITNVKEITLFDGYSNLTQYLTVDDENIKLEKPESLTGLIDKMLPSADDVSGPLYFMGFSILNTKSLPSMNQANLAGVKASIFNSIIQGGTTLVFAIEMLILCIIAVMRILYLWVFIILSPIAILLRCLKMSGENTSGDKGFLKDIKNSLNFLDIKTFFINVFKPTIVVLGLGVAVILTSLMSDIVTNLAVKSPGDGIDFGGVSFSSTKDSNEMSQTEGDTTYTSTMTHNLFTFTLKHVGKTLLELILSILTVILVYQIIKFAVVSGGEKGGISKRIAKLQGDVGELIGSTPIIPVAGYDDQGNKTTHYLSASSILNVDSSGKLRSRLLDEKVYQYENKVRNKFSEQEKIIDSWFGNTGLTSAERGTIQRMIGNSGYTNGLQKLTEIKKSIEKTEKGKGMTLNGASESSRFWIEQFTKWLSETKKENIRNIEGISNSDIEYWKGMVERWQTEKAKNNNPTLEKMFKSSPNGISWIRAYARLFGLTGNIVAWNVLKEKDISKEGDTTTTDESGDASDTSDTSDTPTGETETSAQGDGTSSQEQTQSSGESS